MNNPFEPAFGNRPEKIVGRDKELDTIIGGLATRSGSRSRATFISGLRGMGKTALLLEIESRASKLGFVVARSVASEHMTSTLIERLQIRGSQFVGESRRHISGFNAGALGFSFGLTFTDEVRQGYGFETKLGLLCDRLSDEAGLGVMLLVDEVLASSGEMRELATAYQNLVGDGKNIAICMAGLPSAVSDVLNDKVLTFLNRATKIEVGPIDTLSICTYYLAAFKEAGVVADRQVVERAAELCEGFPYLMQLIGYYLVEDGRETAIDSQVLERALEHSKKDLASNVFRPTLDALSHKDVEFLVAMAQDRGRTRMSDVQARMGVDNGYAQNYRRRLLGAGVIQAPRRGEVEFAVPYLSAYLRDGGR